MFTAVHLQNFRSLADSGRMRLAPVTLLLGPNSAGKSSILAALKLAKQTVESRDIEGSLVLSGAYVDLGTYEDVVYRHLVSKNLAVTYEWHDRRFSGSTRPNHFAMTCEFGYNRKTWEVYPTRQEVRALDGSMWAVRTRRSATSSRIEIGDRDGIALSNASRARRSKFYDFTLAASVLMRQQRALLLRESLITNVRLSAARFEVQFRNTFFLGPVRGDVARSYPGGTEVPSDVGLRGETTARALWSANRRKSERERVLGSVNKWLDRLGIAASIRVKRTDRTDFRLMVRDPETEIESNIVDVGFGVSQVLPVVVLGCLVPRNSTVVVEQPEIHLHPGAQLELGDFFSELAKEGKQFIIETHSEHLLRRVQSLVAEKKADPEMFAVHYVWEDSEGSHVTELPISADGTLQNLPPGFFEHAPREALRRVKAASAGRS